MQNATKLRVGFGRLKKISGVLMAVRIGAAKTSFGCEVGAPKVGSNKTTAMSVKIDASSGVRAKTKSRAIEGCPELVERLPAAPV